MGVRHLGLPWTFMAFITMGCRHEAPIATTTASSTLSAWPSISGLAEIAPNTFVVVHDCKAGSGQPALGLVSIGKDPSKSTYAPVSIEPAIEPPPNDLEALDVMQGKPMTVIALESGDSGASRRALLLELADRNGKMTAKLRAKPLDLRAATSNLNNIESLAIESADLVQNRATVLLADRTPLESVDRVDVKVMRIVLDFNSGSATSSGIAYTFAFPLPAYLGKDVDQWRACSDIAMDKDGSLFVAGAGDRGSRGPFASMIYRVSTSQSSQPPSTTVIATVDGLKIEGLARMIDKSRLWFGTDDESFGGIVRALPLADPTK